MRTEYYLEIYEPNDSRCIAGGYFSLTPFMAINVGDCIKGGTLNSSSNNKSLRVVALEHIIWNIEGSHTAHKLCIHTELWNKA